MSHPGTENYISTQYYNLHKMIELNSLKGQGFDGDFYKLHFQRLGFLLFPPPDLSGLEAFGRANQRVLGKTCIRFNLVSLVKYPHFFKDVNYVLVSEYREMLFLPYLVRMAPQIHIIVSSLALQLARTALQTFQERLADYDATSQQPDFFKQSDILGRYEHHLDTDFEDWRRLYSSQEVQAVLDRVIKVNYHQIYNTERGVHLRALPSGKNNGSCFWELLGAVTNQKILVISEVSQHKWRTCQPIDLERLRESHQLTPYQLVVLGRKALETNAEGEEGRLAETIRKVNSNAESNINTTIVLSDDTLCIDLIPRLHIRPQGRISSILLKQPALHAMHNFVNSYVDYLSSHYREQLFIQTPDYPLLHYSKLKEKQLLIVGSLEELAVRRKLPLREVVSQCQPFVQFVGSYDYSLEREQIQNLAMGGRHVVEQVRLSGNFSGKLLGDFLSVVGRARVVSFGEGGSGIECLQLGKKYIFEGQRRPAYHITASNCSTALLQRFTLANNQLELAKVNMPFLKLPRNWVDLLAGEVQARRMVVEERGRGLRFGSTWVRVEEGGVVRIRSSNVEELWVVERWLEERGAKYALG